MASPQIQPLVEANHIFSTHLDQSLPIEIITRKPPPATSTPATKPSLSFLPFSALPSELRIKIWLFALLEPRVIEVKCKKATTAIGHRQVRNVTGFYSSAESELLKVCQESRHECLQFYDRCLVGPAGVNPVSAASVNWEANVVALPEDAPKTGVYLSFDNDIVRLSENLLAYLKKEDRSAVRHLMVDVNDLEYFFHYHKEALQQCSTLKTLHFVVGEALRNEPGMWMYDRNRVFEVFLREIGDAIDEREDWNVPQILIYHATTGKLLAKRNGRLNVWQRVHGQPFPS